MAEPTVQQEKRIAIPGAVVIKDLAAALGLPVNRVIAELMKNGVMSSMNERIDFDTAAVIAEDLGFAVTLKEENDEERQKTIAEQLAEHLQADDPGRKSVRPPVIVVMGHVDHGKTKLLDTIRETNIVSGEAGGITQHIGAYQLEKKGKLITFIDTPGHEAFSAMRSRGARVADIAILVVAADDGLKPQTLEAITIIQQAQIPFVVAINKIDKPEANIERVKQQLAEQNLLPEDWGGKIITVPVSAETKEGIDVLLETLLLVADVEQEHLRADPDRKAVGSVIEAHIDKGEGPVATVVVRTGTLRQGDSVKIGSVVGRVKALKDWRGETITAAGPSTPAKMLGLRSAPEVGDILLVVNAEEARMLRREQKQRTDRSTTQVRYQQKKKEGAEEHPQKEMVQKLNIVLRSDNLGSQEAILESLQKYEGQPVTVEVVTKGLGSMTDADVLRADTAKALLVGFHVVPTPRAVEVAKSKGLTIRTYTVIYDLLNDIHKELETLLPVEVLENVVGRVRVLVVFRKDKKGMIVGGKVLSGIAKRGITARVLRNEEVIGTVNVTQVQSEKKVVSEVQQGSECGLRIEGAVAVDVQDVLELFEREERRVTLNPR